MPEAPTQFQLDNGCNLQIILKRRAPENFASMRILIDEPHFRGHTNCSHNYSTRAGSFFRCIPGFKAELAESFAVHAV